MERDLAVLAVHGTPERNSVSPATLLPASSYSEQEVAATAVKLQQKVRGAGTACVVLTPAAASRHMPCIT
jgi:hypothetical protein